MFKKLIFGEYHIAGSPKQVYQRALLRRQMNKLSTYKRQAVLDIEYNCIVLRYRFRSIVKLFRALHHFGHRTLLPLTCRPTCEATFDYR